jgi:hypothetical protein
VAVLSLVRTIFYEVIAMNMPDLFDVVELQRGLPELGLTRGAQATIVECYPDGEYEVEFVDEDGQTLALCALPLDKISVVYQANTKQKGKNHGLHARRPLSLE